MKRAFLIFALTAVFYTLGSAQDDKNKPAKMTAEEVVAKHLASIGTPENLAAGKTRFYVGEATKQDATSAANPTKSAPAQFATDGKQLMMAMMFDDGTESVAFNGEEQTLDFPKKHSLGEFFKVKKQLTKNGFLGGVLSTAWPLLNLKAADIRLDYVGITEAAGRKYYHLRYWPSTELITVNLFFDAQNFRHVTSEYIYNGDGSGFIKADGKGEVHKLVEVFSDFKKAGNLILPMRYTLRRSDDDSNLSVSITPSTYRGLPAEVNADLKVSPGKQILSYTISFKEIYLNESLDQTIFKISKKP